MRYNIFYVQPVLALFRFKMQRQKHFLKRPAGSGQGR